METLTNVRSKVNVPKKQYTIMLQKLLVIEIPYQLIS